MSTVPVLPRVSGRHQNHALAAARHARAVQLAAEGRSYQAIADELGYRNKGTVRNLGVPQGTGYVVDGTPGREQCREGPGGALDA